MGASPGQHGSILDSKLGNDNHLSPSTARFYRGQDPRSSSTQSLVPSDSGSASNEDPRRTLLLIYIHGFYGNDQSFRSFPYHVHSYLKEALAETHTIHSKIYPRYKTYRAIEVARDNFSEWLAPHESPTTDVILVGHSMGGILAADVVLMPNHNPSNHRQFKHRILGTISLDTPFLGLHPGIIVSGISSLFHPAQEPPTADQGLGSDASASTSSISLQPQLSPGDVPPGHQPLAHRPTADPLFNPLFFNDNPFKEAPLVKRMMHFANKYRSAGIINATAKHLLSHLEYGGCLADFPGLNSRYRRIRGLEDVDELRQINGPADEARVRFVNYYTLSSGRKKPPKPSSSANPTPDLTPFPSQSADGTSLMTRETTMDTGTSMSSFSTGPSPSIAVQDKGSDHIDTSSDPPPSYKENSEVLPTADESQHDKQDAESIRSGVDHFSMLELDPCPLPDDDQSYAMDQGNSMDESSITDQTLPPIPDLPTRPTTPDFEQYTDKDARKQAEKEFRRVQKSHERAVKDRNKAVREREKAVEKRRREAQKEAEKLLREEAKFFQRQQQQAKKLQKEEEKAIQRLQQQEEDTSRQDTASASIDRREPITDSLATQTATSGGDKTPPEGKKKNKKFCTLPPKRNGVADSTWVDVYMDGMDEVSAHCGLFFPGPHYDRLIGDVGMRIVGWVQDDLTRRAILEMEQLSVD